MKLSMVAFALTTLFSASVWAQGAALATRVATVQRTLTQANLQAPRISSLSQQALAAATANVAINPQINATLESLFTGIEGIAQSNDDVVSGLNKAARVKLADKLVALAVEVASQDSAVSMNAKDWNSINAILDGGGFRSLTGMATPQQVVQGDQLRKFESLVDAMAANIAQGQEAVAAAEAAAEQVLDGQYSLDQIADSCGSAGPRQ